MLADKFDLAFKKNLKGRLLAAFSGCLLPFAFAPYNIWPLSIIACLLLLASLDKQYTKESFIRSLLFGFGFYSFGVSWVYISIAQHGASSAPLAFALTSIFISVLSFFFALPFTFFGRYLNHNKLAILIGFPALWVINEWIKSWLFTGFPWLYLGYAGIDTPLTGLAPIFGIYSLSFAICLTASILFIWGKSTSSFHSLYKYSSRPQFDLFFANNTFIKRHTNQASSKTVNSIAVLSALTCLWLSCVGLNLYAWTHFEKQGVSVGIAQANIPQERKWDIDFIQPTFDIFRELSSTLWQQDWLIWPEAAIPMLSTSAESVLEELDNYAQNRNTTFFTGIIVSDPEQQRFYNSIIALGNGSGEYYKQRLVPFGEYVPFEKQLRGIIAFFDLPTSIIHVGPSNQKNLIAHNKVANNKAANDSIFIAPSVCYEIVYPDLIAKQARGASVLLTISNDAWFGDSIGPVQHFMMARMRAVETGRYLIRATNNGISGFINPKGKVLVRGGRFTREAVTGSIQKAYGITPFMVWRSWPIVILCFMILTLLIIQQRRLAHIQPSP